MALSYESTLKNILDNPKYKAVFEKYIPGLSNNPVVAMGKNLAIKQLLKQPKLQSLGLTQEKVDAMLDECNKSDS